MAAPTGTVQQGWEAVLARVYARDVADTVADFTRFKIGEGAYVSGPPEPIPPDASFSDLQSEGSPLAGGGTANFNNASTGVTGIGTTFLADVTAGQWIKPGPTVSASPFSAGVPGSEIDEWGQVQTVLSDTSIVLMSPYTGPTTLGREVRKANEPLYTFRKDLLAGDVLFASSVPAITEILAVVLATEALSDQLGNAPRFFELGIFDSNGVMAVYMTFPMEEQTGVQFNHLIELVF